MPLPTVAPVIASAIGWVERIGLNLSFRRASVGTVTSHTIINTVDPSALAEAENQRHPPHEFPPATLDIKNLTQPPELPLLYPKPGTCNQWFPGGN